MIKKSLPINFLSYKSFFIFFFSVLILSSSVLAYYSFSYEKDVNYEIIGSKRNLLILMDLSNQIFNVSEDLTNVQDLKLVNQNGVTNMSYTLNLNVINLDPGNCTIEGDVTFQLGNSDGIILNGSNFTMYSGMNNMNLTTTALNNRICPQNITASLLFSEL